METETFAASVAYLKDVITGIGNAKVQDIAGTRNLYMALCKVEITARSAPQTELVSTSNLVCIEEIFNSKFINLNRSMTVVVVNIYEIMLKQCPGYVVRNVMNTLLTVCNSKVSSMATRECASTVIGTVLETRSADVGSMINDAINSMIKLIRGSEHPVRLAAAQATVSILTGAGSRASDCHLELSKLCSKLITDRSVDLRQRAAFMLGEMSNSSGGFATVSFDALLAPAVKGLEDEVGAVQESFAHAVALIYVEQIHAFAEEQEQARAGIARGGAASGDPSRNPTGKATQRGSLAKLKDMTSLKDMISSTPAPKKGGDDNDYKSVMKNIYKIMVKSTPVLRAGYVSVLRHLIQLLMRTLTMDSSDLEWLSTSVILLLRDPAIVALPYEDIVNFRSRLSHLIRSGVSSNLTESNQIALATSLCTFLATTDIRTEHEIQLALGELGHIVSALGEVAACVSDEVKAVTNIQLRNSSFGVRAASAYLLASLATALPAAAAVFLKDALTGAATQAKQLLTFDEADYSASTAVAAGADASGADDGTTSPSPSGGQASPRKNPKDVERLQRMFFFHGHSLVISIFLKNEKWLPTGLPAELIMKAFDFGLEMLTLDIQSAPQALRHVVCSVIRAGSLIVSSCLNMGYKVAKPRIGRLLECCTTLLRPTASAPPASNTPAAGQDLLYELMSAEAALVCISTLLWFCPDSLVYDENCLITIVDGLESVFRAIKGKYQSKFRGHFRFRTLHVILLECFAWLPPGSFPNTCAQLFVEALRVFRDSITAGYECTCLSEFMPPDHAILNVAGVSKPPSAGCTDLPITEDLLVLRLEQHSVALQKKESEAFLACFSKEVHLPEFRRTPLHATDWMEPTPPCAFIDSRTVDASIALIAATFGHQTNEYQEKAVQLCSQAMAQYLKTAGTSATLGLFSSEEERKKKDKKSYVSIKNVTAVLSAIIRSFPFHNGMSLELDLQWVGAVADRIFEMLSFPNIEIRAVSATSLGVFCSKIFGAQLMDSMGMKITQAIRNSVDRKGETMADLSGHILALSSLWLYAESSAVQDNILTIVFDTLKRVDCSLMFRAHGVFSLCCIIKHRSHLKTASDAAETNALVEKVMQVLEVHLLCSGLVNDLATPYEFPLLLVCLQRLINTILPTILELDPQSQHLENLIKMWSIIRKSCNIPAVQQECADFLLAISGFHVAALDPRDAALFVKECIRHPERTTTEHLRTVIASVRSLVLDSSAAVRETGLDMQLFSLLDWCIASSVTACTSSPYWGVELRSGVDRVVLGSTRDLQREIEHAIESLVAVEVPNQPDKFSTEWVLLSRVIALGLRGGGVGASQEQDKDVEGDAEHEDGGEKSEASATVIESVPTSMTTLQYSNWCRDNALARAKDVEATRVRVKCVALRCATSALTTCKTDLSPFHSDIRAAKVKTQELLDSLGSSQPDAVALSTLPRYLALFLHDLINFGCACASFSVEDHRMLELQTVAIEFLNALMHHFWNTVDPDDHSRPANAMSVIVPAEQKILMQFMAQIVSAIRPALSSKWAPNLQWTAGGLVFNIILDGLLNDKVVVRRLAKMLLHNLEGEGAAAFKPRATFALEVAGEVSTIEHIVRAANMARLFLLTSEYGKEVGCIDKTIQEAILSMLTPHLADMQSVWLGIAIDAARVLQSQTTWPKSSPMTDCRRGGISYSPEVDPVKLVWHLEYALPFVGAAVSLTGQIPEDKIAVMFAIDIALLGHLNAHSAEAGISISHVDGESLIRGMKGSLEPLVLTSLKAIAGQCTLQLQSEPHAELYVPIAQWAQLVTFLTNDVAVNFLNIPQSSFGECSTQCELIIQLVDSLLSFVASVGHTEEALSEEQREDKTHLASRLWVLSITMTQIVFGGLFLLESATDFDVSAGNAIYPPLCAPTRSMTEKISLRLWLNTPSGLRVAKTTVKVLESAARTVGNVDTVVYAANLLIGLVAYVLCLVEDSAEKASLLCAVSDALAAVNDKSLLADLLLHEIFSLSQSGQADMLISADADVAEYGRALFSSWLHVCCDSFVQAGTSIIMPSPVQLAVVLIKVDSSQCIIQGVLTACLQTLQQQVSLQQPARLQAGLCIVSSCVIPPLLHVLMGGGYNDTLKTLLLHTALSALCGFLDATDSSSAPALLCGKGVTHIARTSPQIFRGEIMLLPESSRATLQNAMRAVLEAMNQSGATVTQTGASGSPGGTIGAPPKIGGPKEGGIKKIDMSKYRGGT